MPEEVDINRTDLQIDVTTAGRFIDVTVMHLPTRVVGVGSSEDGNIYAARGAAMRDLREILEA